MDSNSAAEPPEPPALLHAAGSPTREEVGHDAVEEGHVHGQELAEVDVDDGAQHEHELVLLRETPLEVARGAQHSHHRAHAVVVVVLRQREGAHGAAQAGPVGCQRQRLALRRGRLSASSSTAARLTWLDSCSEHSL